MARINRANGTIIRCRFVKLDATGGNADQCVIPFAAANDKPIGISQDGGRTAPIPDYTTDPYEAATAGENVRVHEDGDECLLEIGTGGCSPGDRLVGDSGGKGIKVASTHHPPRVGAVALRTAAAGELCLVKVTIFDAAALAYT